MRLKCFSEALSTILGIYVLYVLAVISIIYYLLKAFSTVLSVVHVISS